MSGFGLLPNRWSLDTQLQHTQPLTKNTLVLAFCVFNYCNDKRPPAAGPTIWEIALKRNEAKFIFIAGILLSAHWGAARRPYYVPPPSPRKFTLISLFPA